MRFIKQLIFVSFFLILIAPICVHAETEIRMTKSGPVLCIDEPKARFDVNIDLLYEIIGLVMENHIEREEFNTTKMSLGLTRGFLNGIGVRKFVLASLAKRNRHLKSGSNRKVIQIKNGKRTLTIDISLLFEEIRIEAAEGHLKNNSNKHRILMGMVDGFMSSLDKYSCYLTNKEADELLSRLEGEPEEEGGSAPQTVACGIMNIHGKKVGAIKIIAFDKNTPNQFQDYVKRLMLLEPEYIIFDLRDNPGGYVSSVAEVLALVVGKGKTIFTIEGPPGKITPVKTLEEAGNGIFNSGKKRIKKIVCLVNKYTASAGEVMAAGLRDILDVKLVGERTHGKGTGWSPYKLESGRGVCIITNMRWFTPKGKCIKDIGLMPSIVVRLTLKDLISGRDPQLDAAIKELFN